MKAAHIVTVGTSFVQNWKKGRGDGSLPLPSAAQLAEMARRNPVAASAELAAMYEYLERGEVAEVYLVHTETPEGRRSAEGLTLYLRERAIRVDTLAIGGYEGSGDETRFLDGLRILAERVAARARRLRRAGVPVLFNATGGYKPEVAILVSLACAFRWTVYYRHESFSRTVELPHLPLPAPSRAVLAVLGALASAPERRAVGPQARALLEEHGEAIDEAMKLGYVREREDETSGALYAYDLTAGGKLAWESYREDGGEGA